MRGFLATFGRELRAYFFSPLAYVVLTFFLLVNGYVFWLIVSYLNDPRAQAGALPLFGQTIFFWLVLLFVAPVLTMRLLSEERRSGTIEMLMTAPVTETQVVLGKYAAALGYYAFLWLPTLVYVWVVAHFGSVDPGPVLSGYLGVLGIGALPRGRLCLEPHEEPDRGGDGHLRFPRGPSPRAAGEPGGATTSHASAT